MLSFIALRPITALSLTFIIGMAIYIYLEHRKLQRYYDRLNAKAEAYKEIEQELTEIIQAKQSEADEFIGKAKPIVRTYTQMWLAGRMPTKGSNRRLAKLLRRGKIGETFVTEQYETDLATPYNHDHHVDELFRQLGRKYREGSFWYRPIQGIVSTENSENSENSEDSELSETSD